MQFLKRHKKDELNNTSIFLIYGIVSDNASLYLVCVPDFGLSHLSVLGGGVKAYAHFAHRVSWLTTSYKKYPKQRYVLILIPVLWNKVVRVFNHCLISVFQFMLTSDDASIALRAGIGILYFIAFYIYRSNGRF